MQPRPPENRSRRRDRVLGLLILCSAFALCMGVSVWGRDAAIEKPAPDPSPPTKDLPGFPKEVEPLEVLAVAQAVSIRPLFQGFVAEGVKPDGTMNFRDKGTALRFSFQSLPGRGPQPQRNGGTLPARAYCGRQNVMVGRAGLVAAPDKPSIFCSGPDPRALPPPTACTLKQVWSVAAKDRGLAPRGEAEIEYFRGRLGPAYRFAAKDSKGKMVRFALSARDCKTILVGSDQRGAVP